MTYTIGWRYAKITFVRNGCQLSVISCQLPIKKQLKRGCQLSVISCQLPIKKQLKTDN